MRMGMISRCSAPEYQIIKIFLQIVRCAAPEKGTKIKV